MPKKVTKTPKKVTDKKPKKIPYYTLSLKLAFWTEAAADRARNRIIEVVNSEFKEAHPIFDNPLVF